MGMNQPGMSIVDMLAQRGNQPFSQQSFGGQQPAGSGNPPITGILAGSGVPPIGMPPQDGTAAQLPGSMMPTIPPKTPGLQMPMAPPDKLTENHAHQTINMMLVYITQILKSTGMPPYKQVELTVQLTQAISSLATLTQNNEADSAEQKQAELALKQQEMDMKMKFEEQKLQFEEYKMEKQLELETMKAQHKMELEKAQAESKMQVQAEQAEMAKAQAVQGMEQSDEQHQQALEQGADAHGQAQSQGNQTLNHNADKHQQEMSHKDEAHKSQLEQAKSKPD